MYTILSKFKKTMTEKNKKYFNKYLV